MALSTLDLEAGVGVPPFRFGMTIDQVRSAMLPLGVVDDVTAPGGAPALRWYDEARSFDIYLNFRADGRLFTIQLWRSPLPDGAVPVRWHGVDLFGQPADGAIAALRAAGEPVDTSDALYPMARDEEVGFNREGGDDVDDDGVAIRFESVLVAPSGYARLYTAVELPEFD
jgi:hypothetical protein